MYRLRRHSELRYILVFWQINKETNGPTIEPCVTPLLIIECDLACYVISYYGLCVVKRIRSQHVLDLQTLCKHLCETQLKGFSHSTFCVICVIYVIRKFRPRTSSVFFVYIKPYCFGEEQTYLIRKFIICSAKSYFSSLPIGNMMYKNNFRFN